MKVTKTVKETLVNILKQIQVNGNPDDEKYQKSLEAYRETRTFVESLEVES